MPQIIAPFYIAPPGTNPPTNITQLRPQQGLARGELKLVVISGGPVFLFEDDLSAQACYDRTHAIGGKGVDFDLAAAVNAASEVLKEQFPSLMTLMSDVETIGFIQFKEDKR